MRRPRPVRPDLRGYALRISEILGIPHPYCSVREEEPAEIYLAVDAELPDYPDRDTALVWREGHGWSIAVATHSGEDFLLVDDLSGPITPPARRVAQWAVDLVGRRARRRG